MFAEFASFAGTGDFKIEIGQKINSTGIEASAYWNCFEIRWN